MSFRIMVIESSPTYQLIVKSTLGSEFDLEIVESGSQAMDKIAKHDFQMVILDIDLPDMDGFQICAKLRHLEKTMNLPIIFLSLRDTENEKLMAFALGADDYIVKPFRPLELKARVRAKFRSFSMANTVSEVSRYGNLEIHRTSNRVYLIDKEVRQEIALTSLEYKLFLYFTNNVDRVLSRLMILESVWQNNPNVTERTVDAHISKLRKKLGTSSRYIESLHGSGYRFAVTPINPVEMNPSTILAITKQIER